MLQEQRSFEGESKHTSESNKRGRLFLVATPIGNLGDITYRAVETLRQADCIAAEDTRHTRKLLSHLDIHPQALISYHEHNKQSVGQVLVERLESGQTIALVSDAGTPAIADPGFELVKLATAHDFPVISIPGPNAAISALIASGIVPHPFLFHGFLSREKKDAAKELSSYQAVPATLVLYEAPHRLKQTLQICFDTLGNRQATLARELTKKHEHFLRGNLQDLLDWATENEVRGECCLIIAPRTAEEVRLIAEETCMWKDWSISKHLEYYVEAGQTEKEAMRLVAKDRDLRKRDVYQAILDEKNQANR